MANIKSAKKRILVTQTKTARNKSIRSKVKTSMKKVDAAIAAGDKAAAQASLVNAISEIDKACSKRRIPQEQRFPQSCPFEQSGKRHGLTRKSI